jgi:hypothetical protein
MAYWHFFQPISEAWYRWPSNVLYSRCVVSNSTPYEEQVQACDFRCSQPHGALIWAHISPYWFRLQRLRFSTNRKPIWYRSLSSVIDVCSVHILNTSCNPERGSGCGYLHFFIQTLVVLSCEVMTQQFLQATLLLPCHGLSKQKAFTMFRLQSVGWN